MFCRQASTEAIAVPHCNWVSGRREDPRTAVSRARNLEGMGMVESVLFILVQIIVSYLLWFVAEPSKALVFSIRNGNHYELCKTMISGWKWLLLDWHGSECVCLVWSFQIHWNPSIGSGGGGVRYQPCVVFFWTGWILKVHTGLHFWGQFFASVSSGVSGTKHQIIFHGIGSEMRFIGKWNVLFDWFYLPFPQNHCSTNMIRNNFFTQGAKHWCSRNQGTNKNLGWWIYQ